MFRILHCPLVAIENAAFINPIGESVLMHMEPLRLTSPLPGSHYIKYIYKWYAPDNNTLNTLLL